MFKCTECGLEFESPTVIYEDHGEQMIEKFSVCPNCQGNYEEFDGQCCGNCIHYDYDSWCEQLNMPIDDESEVGCREWRWKHSV